MKNNFDNYIVSFGIEVHVSLLTKTKAFSNSPTSFGVKNAPPNTNIGLMDLGYPGIKPLVNKKMVELSYRACKIFNMEIDKKIIFDRKNYFYPDLPKGYQITQKFFPIGKNGYLNIFTKDNKVKKINITELHMEEDTAKKILDGKNSLYDFNRSGNPLIEIVSSYKEFETSDDVILYLKKLRQQLMFFEISTCDMSNGLFRVDVNISIRKKRNNLFGEKVEIKNLNSFVNIKNSIDFEIQHQINQIENGEKIISVTKKYDEKTKKNIVMRTKITDNHYNFICEGNINPIELSNDLVSEFNKYHIFNIDDIYMNLIQNNTPIHDVNILLKNVSIYNIYLKIFSKNSNIKIGKCVSFVSSILYPILQKNDAIKLLKEDMIFNHLMSISTLFFNKKIIKEELNYMLNKLFQNNDITDDLMKIDNLSAMSKNEIIHIVSEYINKNLESKNDYKKKPDKTINFIVGKILKEWKGKMNPLVLKEIVIDILENE